MENLRLDKYLNENFGVGREKAKELIKNEKVLVNGKVEKKPSLEVSSECVVEIIEEDYNKYASRGAYKLLQAINDFNINIEGKRCLDVGASTGGFTDVMLEYGATEILAVDTGTNQLHEKLLNNDKVISLQNTNILNVNANSFGKFSFVTIDVSFVSIMKIIPHVATLLEDDTTCVFLVKPQFEVGQKGLNKKGVVKSDSLREKALTDVIDFCKTLGFTDVKYVKSETIGHSGNIEYLVYLKYTNR